MSGYQYRSTYLDSFVPHSISLWNSLPSNITSARSVLYSKLFLLDRVYYWASMSRSIHCSRRGQLSWSLILHAVTAITCIYCPASFVEQVSSTVRPCLSDADRGGGKGLPTESLDERNCCIAPSTHCYLTHACPTILYIHLVIGYAELLVYWARPFLLLTRRWKFYVPPPTSSEWEKQLQSSLIY